MAEDKELETKLRELVVERLFLKANPSEIDWEANLMETYGVDSVGLFDLLIGLEEVFGIKMDEQEFQVEIFSSLKSIADFIQSHPVA